MEPSISVHHVIRNRSGAMLILTIECLSWFVLTTAAPGPFEDATETPWYKSLVERAAPVVHDIVAAGFGHCEDLKKLLGLSYEQVQTKNMPDTENSLYIDLITPSGSQKMNISSVKDLPRSTEYDQGKPLVVLVHGFMESSEGQTVREISQAFLDRGGYNVMALDGGKLINVMYFRSTTYVRFIGEKLGQVLAQLVNDSALSPAKITIVGHSLGAHIAGISGKEFYRLVGARIGRITGLDPAGPCFTKDENIRLHRDDAEFVDVIHTDGGLLGLKEPVGDQDYFPNGGSIQPGCLVLPCCHSRAWQFYAESVRIPSAFPAWSCSDWEAFNQGNCSGEPTSFMGLDAVPDRPGSYFLHTAEKQPYSSLDEIHVSS